MTKKSALIPLIRSIMPSVIAQDIVGVQPMSQPAGQIFRNTSLPTSAFVVLKDHFPPAPEGHIVIDANRDVSDWIQDQPIHMWKWHEDCKTPFGKNRFYISEKLYTLLAMRFE